MIELKEIVYHVSGILSGIFLTLTVILMYKKNINIIRTNIFLKYKQFQTAFLALTMGSIIFILGNIFGLFYHEEVIFHEISEIVYNLSMLIFAFLIFNLINERRSKTKNA